MDNTAIPEMEAQASTHLVASVGKVATLPCSRTLAGVPLLLANAALMVALASEQL